jgi:dTMP kinase
MKRFYGKGLPGVSPKDLMGKLIVLEGADGSGRSTQADLLTAWLERKGYATVNVGLNRSTLVSKDLSQAKQGNVLTRRTFSLFYATDFADQLENRIIPALRAGFVVLADRYIYTLIARDVVRGMDRSWVESLYGVAVVPDVVFYLQVSPRQLIERNFQKHATLDHWESGMDLGLSSDMFQSFLKYQGLIQDEFKRMQQVYGFDILNGNRSVRAVAKDLQARVEPILGRRAA